MKIPFMKVPGSDPSAVMKGDIPQTVAGASGPRTKAKRPQPVRAGNFSLKREKKKQRK